MSAKVTAPAEFARFDAHVRPDRDPSPPRARCRHRRADGALARLLGGGAAQASRPDAGGRHQRPRGARPDPRRQHVRLVRPRRPRLRRDVRRPAQPQALARRGPGRGPHAARHAHPQHRHQGQRLRPDDDPRPRIRPLGDQAPAAPVRPQAHAVPRAHRAGARDQGGRGLRRAEHRAQQVHDGRQPGQLLHPHPPRQPLPGVDEAWLRPGPVAHLRGRGHQEAHLLVRRLPRRSAPRPGPRRCPAASSRSGSRWRPRRASG